MESGESEEDNEEREENGVLPAREPDALIILADEELVAIDLQSEDWKMMNLPYLVSLHASAVICSQHVSSTFRDHVRLVERIFTYEICRCSGRIVGATERGGKGSDKPLVLKSYVAH